MVDENLTDEQQADIIRNWLRENSLFMLGGIGLALASIFGWSQWEASELRGAEEASEIYENLVAKIRANAKEDAEALLQELVAGYEKSPYVDQARLHFTKFSLDRNDFDVAASYLESIIADSSNEELLQIARVRLARVRLQQAQYDEALSELDRIDPDSAFSARVNDVRGDIYVALDRPEDALAAYDAALTDPRQPPTIDRAYVQAKRDSLGVDDPAITEDISAGANDAPAASE